MAGFSTLLPASVQKFLTKCVAEPGRCHTAYSVKDAFENCLGPIEVLLKRQVWASPEEDSTKRFPTPEIFDFS